MTLALCGMLVGTIGPGGWSLDRALDIDDDLIGWPGLALSAGLGLVGALLLLATCWRRPAE
jgi:putative oxidoreductase